MNEMFYFQQQRSKEIFRLILSISLLVGGIAVALLAEYIASKYGINHKVIEVPAFLLHLLGIFGMVRFILIGKEYVYPKK